MPKSLDTASQIVTIAAGAGLLYLGYKAVSALTAPGALSNISKATATAGSPAGVIPGAEATFEKGDQQCHETVGIFSTATECDAPAEPDAVKAKGRSDRLRWAITNQNPHTLADALPLAGQDMDAEVDAFRLAGNQWRKEADYFGLNRDWGKVLTWWGANRATSPATKQAAADADLAHLASVARGEIFE